MLSNNVISHGIDLGLDVLEPRSRVTPAVTIYSDIPVGNGFYVSPSVAYQQRAFEVGESLTLNIFEVPIPIGASARIHTKYLQGATDLKYKFGNDKIKGVVRAGPYVGYALDGRADLMLNSIINIKVASIPFNTNGKLLDPWEFGASAGAGFEVKAGPGVFSLEGTYQRSFSDFTDIPFVDVGLKNHAWGANIGYAIPIGSKSKKAMGKA